MSAGSSNDRYPTTVGMSDAQVAARQWASRRVTVASREANDDDPWDVTISPRPARLLVERFDYAEVPNLRQVL